MLEARGCPALLSSGAEATGCFLFAHRAGPAALFSFEIYGVLIQPHGLPWWLRG